MSDVEYKDQGEDKLEHFCANEDSFKDGIRADYPHAVMTIIPRSGSRSSVVMSQFIYPSPDYDPEDLECAKRACKALWGDYTRAVKSQLLWAKRLSGYYKRYPGKNSRKQSVVIKLLTPTPPKRKEECSHVTRV